MLTNVDVLIIGAGPVGLTLANILALNGVNFIIVDKLEKWSERSRAMTITPRTLEHLHTLGVTNKMLECGVPTQFINFYYKKAWLGKADFRKLKTKYNYILQISQSNTAHILRNNLKKLGDFLKHPFEFKAMQRTKHGVISTLEHMQTKEEFFVDAKFLVACDGGRSTVREQDGIAFDGGEFKETFVMADVAMKGFSGTFNERHHFFLPGRNFLCVMPIEHVNNDYIYRIITLEKYNLNFDSHTVLNKFNEIFMSLNMNDIKFSDLRWVSQFNPKQFVVSKFYNERIIYVGDAAHIQSPVGSQGLNTGIQDAFNIGWRLSLMLKQRLDESVLQSYHHERYPVALNLFNYNNKISNTAFGYNYLRRQLLIFSKSLHFFNYYNNKEINGMSQLLISYNKNKTNIYNPEINAGDRLPYVEFSNGKTIYDLVSVRGMTIFIFCKDKDISTIFDDRDFSKSTQIVILSKHESVSKDVDNKIINIFDHRLKIHKMLAIHEPTMWIARPDTYIADICIGIAAIKVGCEQHRIICD